MDWASISERFSQHLLTRGKTAATAQSYTWHSRIFWNWALRRETDPVTANHAAVEAFIASQLRELAPMTVYNRLMSIRSFFDFLINEGLRCDNPTLGLKVKKPKRQPVQPFTLIEMKRLMAHTTSIRDRALILMLADTGMRIGELVGLRQQDVNWLDGTVRVYGKGRKERWVQLGAETMEALSFLHQKRAGLLWLTRSGEPLTAHAIRKNLTALSMRAGVGSTFPHRFRATFANYFLQDGGDLGALQSVLGHSDITTTSFYAGYTRAQRGLEQMRHLNLGGKLVAPAED